MASQEILPIYKNSLALCSIQVADYKNVLHPYVLVKNAKIDETIAGLFDMKKDWCCCIYYTCWLLCFDLQDTEISRFQVVTMSKI